MNPLGNVPFSGKRCLVIVGISESFVGNIFQTLGYFRKAGGLKIYLFGIACGFFRVAVLKKAGIVRNIRAALLWHISAEQCGNFRIHIPLK
jgi:hypothetical protein